MELLVFFAFIIFMAWIIIPSKPNFKIDHSKLECVFKVDGIKVTQLDFERLAKDEQGTLFEVSLKRRQPD